MVDSSNLLLVIAAMVIFGIILTNTNRLIFSNESKITAIEVEAEAIALAQEIVDEARQKVFNSSLLTAEDGNWPEDFSTQFGPPAGASDKNSFLAWEHFHNYKDTIATDQGSWYREVKVYYSNFDQPDEPVTGPTFHKNMEVKVSASNTPYEIRLTALRSGYGFIDK